MCKCESSGFLSDSREYSDPVPVNRVPVPVAPSLPLPKADEPPPTQPVVIQPPATTIIPGWTLPTFEFDFPTIDFDTPPIFNPQPPIIGTPGITPPPATNTPTLPRVGLPSAPVATNQATLASPAVLTVLVIAGLGYGAYKLLTGKRRR